MIRTLLVIGAGLIGTSVALAAESPGERARLRVTLGTRPGDLARLLRDTATHGATVTDAALAGGGELAVHLEVLAGTTDAAISALGGTGCGANRSEHAPTPDSETFPRIS